MKGYCIIYNGRWAPKQCEILGEDNGESLIEYPYRGKTRKARVPSKYVFLTYEAAKSFCYHYE